MLDITQQEYKLHLRNLVVEMLSQIIENPQTIHTPRLKNSEAFSKKDDWQNVPPGICHYFMYIMECEARKYHNPNKSNAFSNAKYTIGVLWDRACSQAKWHWPIVSESYSFPVPVKRDNPNRQAACDMYTECKNKKDVWTTDPNNPYYEWAELRREYAILLLSAFQKEYEDHIKLTSGEYFPKN